MIEGRHRGVDFTEKDLCASWCTTQTQHNVAMSRLYLAGTSSKSVSICWQPSPPNRLPSPPLAEGPYHRKLGDEGGG